MIEMIQAVHWALERPCPLRLGKHWQGPLKTHRQLKDVVAYSDAVANDCIVDDICVTAHASHQSDRAGNATLPVGGFSVSKAFARFGGVEKVQEACNGCDANVGACAGRLWGGCHGSLEVWPHSPDLECALRSVIANCKIEQEFHRCFPRTAPAWFGLWMNSPLSIEQCEFLQAFFRVFSAGARDGSRDLAHFLAGLDAAIQWQLPMHVEVALPRIEELEGDLILAHCPRCKAEARPGRCHPAPLEDELPMRSLRTRLPAGGDRTDGSQRARRAEYRTARAGAGEGWLERIRTRVLAAPRLFRAIHRQLGRRRISATAFAMGYGRSRSLTRPLPFRLA